MFMLSDQQRAISDTATRFGAEHLAPFALQWEKDRHFPVQVLREAGRLKLGGLHVGQDVGGQAMSRVDAALVVEGVATGCPAIAGCLSKHNTAAWMIDTFRCARTVGICDRTGRRRIVLRSGTSRCRLERPTERTGRSRRRTGHRRSPPGSGRGRLPSRHQRRERRPAPPRCVLPRRRQGRAQPELRPPQRALGDRRSPSAGGSCATPTR